MILSKLFVHFFYKVHKNISFFDHFNYITQNRFLERRFCCLFSSFCCFLSQFSSFFWLFSNVYYICKFAEEGGDTAKIIVQYAKKKEQRPVGQADGAELFTG